MGLLLGITFSSNDWASCSHMPLSPSGIFLYMPKCCATGMLTSVLEESNGNGLLLSCLPIDQNQLQTLYLFII